MDEQSNVENTATESTTVADGQQSSAAETSATQDANGSETMQSAMMAAFKKSTGSESSPEESSAEDSSVLKQHETEGEEATEETTEETEASEVAEEKDGEKGESKKPSFQDHPDWKEMVAKKNEYEAKVKEFEPLAQAQLSIAKHLTDNGISPEQFQEGIKFMTLLYTDPLKFKEEFGQTWQQLSTLTGDDLPDDLKAQLAGIDEEVEAGTLSQARAKQFRDSIHAQAKLRGESSIRKTRAELDQKRQLENQQRQFHQEVTKTVTSWVEGKQKTDVSFGPTKDAAKPGRYEMVLNIAKGLAADKPPKTAADVVQLMERAYTMVGTNGVAKPKVASKILTSTNASTTATSKTEPKSMRESMLVAAAKHGVRE